MVLYIRHLVLPVVLPLILAAGPAVEALAASGDGDSVRPPAAPEADSRPVSPALPATADRAKHLNDLFQQLAKAASPAEAAQLKSQIREIWVTTGSPTINLLLARGAQAAFAHDLALQRRLTDAVTHLAPDEPEGWSRRADLDYAEQRLGDAYADLGHVLTIEPRHFDALESLATILRETGRNALALKAFRQLHTIDPTSATIQSEIDDLARKVEGQGI